MYIIRPKRLILNLVNLFLHSTVSSDCPRHLHPSGLHCVRLGIIFVSILWSIYVTVNSTSFLHFQLKSQENHLYIYIYIYILTFPCWPCFVIYIFPANIAETAARPPLISKVKKRTLTLISTVSLTPHLIHHYISNRTTRWRRVSRLRSSRLPSVDDVR